MAATLSFWKFTSPEGAEHALGTLAQLQSQRLIVVQDASVVSWPEGRRKPRTWKARDIAGTVLKRLSTAKVKGRAVKVRLLDG